ncbi:Complex I intermediate-associated protein 84, mitochondrial [Cercospora beticola]|uniref:Complex I intermediate-associated protein 84, mitochondrial n=1 Tax=Cercospora beticola TaxID=122368 RepID=A0A2G5HV50_CERBT|nr:Complex I intermediate-associated protein 84, mitochondrial [Cercospora beticola]PIA96398.1 Complex I intermediate-associated protein 84, mitochondrial [Cercospora beticola]WPB07594.1 hypothetical protein RHO25_012255 [Cercospora beticola]
MPSHLTRYVLRRILANEPILHRACPRRQAYTSLSRSRNGSRSWTAQHGRAMASAEQRRTFFDLNMFGPKKRQVKEADLEPGMEEMMHLAKMQRMNARLPPPEDISQALKQFFSSTHCRVNDRTAKLVASSLEYCWAAEEQGSSPRRYISSQLLVRITKALRKTRAPVTEAHLKLSSLVLQKGQSLNGAVRYRANLSHIRMLGLAGHYLAARNLVEEIEKLGSASTERVSPSEAEIDNEDANEGTASTAQHLESYWITALEAVSKGNSERDLLETLNMISERESLRPPPQYLAMPMLAFYIRTANLEAVQTWWKQYWDSSTEHGYGDEELERGLAFHFDSVLRWCVSHQQLEFGHQVVRQAMTNNPPKPLWDAIFIWAAATGKGADEIGRMLDVMQKSNEDILDPAQWRVPDITTINGLVKYATSKQDPYLAERFIALGQARSIEPDARTYQLQIQYRLKVNDVDGALIAYKNLQAMDLSSNEDVPTVNELIVALCQSKRHDFDTVMNVAMDLADRRARFESTTVTALALLHLNRDEMHDVIDLLNTHAHHYSSAERDKIRSTLLAFCLNPDNPTSRAWDAYKILGTVFDEMPRSERTAAMASFFTRERPDMAVFIFNEMRRHSREDTMPVIDTYVTSFLCSAKLRDLDSLELIHNQLKLDYNITTNTYLQNAMMIAYTACGRPRQALAFWDDIVASKEGPTYNSIHIALRACEKAPFGDLRAKQLWSKLKQMGIELDQSMWASYAAALAGNGDIDLALKSVEEAEGKNEVDVDAFLLGSLYDATAGHAEKQDEVESWARTKFPDAWEGLEKIGIEVNEQSGKKLPKIDRSVTP